MRDSEQPLTAYEILAVHPSAPIELVSSCYWELTGLVRDSGREDAAALIHQLTRAYQTISDPERREAYDAEIGSEPTPLIARSAPQKRFFLFRLFGRDPTWSVEPYEVLGLQPYAPERCIPEAYRHMRNVCLRLPQSKSPERMLSLVEDAYSTVTDPEKRAALRPVRDGGDQEAVDYEADYPAESGASLDDKVIQGAEPHGSAPEASDDALRGGLAEDTKLRNEMPSEAPSPRPKEAPLVDDSPSDVAEGPVAELPEPAPQRILQSAPDAQAASVQPVESATEQQSGFRGVLIGTGRLLRTIVIALSRLIVAAGRVIAAAVVAAGRAVGNIVESSRARMIERRAQQIEAAEADSAFLDRLASTVKAKDAEATNEGPKRRLSRRKSRSR